MSKQDLINRIGQVSTGQSARDAIFEVIDIINMRLDGKVIVPEEPTHKMLVAGNADLCSCNDFDDIYKAILSAAKDSK